MRRLTRRGFVGGLLLLFLTAWSPAATPTSRPVTQPAAPATQPSELTVFVISDTHFGATGMEALNRQMIEHLNTLPGKPYPPTLGGRVAEPRGVLHLGDITDSGEDEQWDQFVQIYASLKYPLFATYGNHDQVRPEIGQRVAQRQGGMPYSFDWDAVHFICLGVYPDAEYLEYLKRDLAAVGPERPIVIFFHYAIQGPYSNGWTEAEKEAFAKVIKGYNVLTILHGHYHQTAHYQWQGIDVLRTGAPRHSDHAFLVLRLRDNELAAAFWNWDKGQWKSYDLAKPLKAVDAARSNAP